MGVNLPNDAQCVRVGEYEAKITLIILFVAGIQRITPANHKMVTEGGKCQYFPAILQGVPRNGESARNGGEILHKNKVAAVALRAQRLGRLRAE